ncbi:TPA: LysM peptidoglycan-binding domain-containing protein [Legionella bozemanae]|uniref:LysM peptidoglycan-binding domain-containing protein n=1 Tax=Legionella bozemanae TaxID=447 RepID=UPI00216B27BE|nr:LysM peptidoglycan-binding domain-containing protein [Legionella bozemanae]
MKADAPKRYVVQHGDILWSIAGRYLDNPWEWKELWLANPKIKNPNRLYPGAVLALAYSGNRLNDPQNRLFSVRLPPERIGEAMVFRVFTKTSFALIVRSTRAVYLLNLVTNP